MPVRPSRWHTGGVRRTAVHPERLAQRDHRRRRRFRPRQPRPAAGPGASTTPAGAPAAGSTRTNNQGELRAVLELFRATAHLDDDLLVICGYVINSVTKWMRGWRPRGCHGKPVMNLELLHRNRRGNRRAQVPVRRGQGPRQPPPERSHRCQGPRGASEPPRNAAIPAGPGWVRAGDAPARRGLVRPRTDPGRRPVAARSTAVQPPLFSFSDGGSSSQSPAASAYPHFGGCVIREP